MRKVLVALLFACFNLRPVTVELEVMSPPCFQRTSFDCVPACFANFALLSYLQEGESPKEFYDSFLSHYLEFFVAKEIDLKQFSTAELKNLLSDKKTQDKFCNKNDFHRKYLEPSSNRNVPNNSLPSATQKVRHAFANQPCHYYFDSTIFKLRPKTPKLKALAQEIKKAEKFYLFYCDDSLQTKEFQFRHGILLVIINQGKEQFLVQMYDPLKEKKHFNQTRLEKVRSTIETLLTL